MNIFPTLEGFLGHCLELEGYRDDCYIATWRTCEVEGHTWEVLDMLSRGESLTFADLHKKLSGRGVTEEVHAEDVRELVGRGWVEEDSGVVQIMRSGDGCIARRGTRRRVEEFEVHWTACPMTAVC